MDNSLQKSVDDFINARLEALLTSNEYQMYIETLYKDLEDKLLAVTITMNKEDKLLLIENLRSSIYDQIFTQNRQAYKHAVRDTMTYMINNLIVPKKFD